MPERLRPLSSQLTQLRTLAWRVCPETPPRGFMTRGDFVDVLVAAAAGYDRDTVQDLIRQLTRMLRETEGTEE